MNVAKGSQVRTHKMVRTLGSAADRLRLIAEGLPILLKSAEELEQVEKLLPGEQQRARAILIGQADEEAAKILILLDAVRCPSRRQADRDKTLTNFYNHLARLLYIKACLWKPGTHGDLTRYVDVERASHYLDGPNGIDFVYRNDALDTREGFLYADLVDHGNGLEWQAPGPRFGGILASLNVPRLDALPVAKALARVGAFSLEGLRTIAKIWNGLNLDEHTHWQEIAELNEHTLHELHKLGSVDKASNKDIQLVCDWQFPMYSLDFTEIPVEEASLEQQRASWEP
jgi:hypothetical protein